MDFPEDDEDDISKLADYGLIKQKQRPKSFSPSPYSPKDNKFFPGKNKRIERQVIFWFFYKIVISLKLFVRLY